MLIRASEAIKQFLSPRSSLFVETLIEPDCSPKERFLSPFGNTFLWRWLFVLSRESRVHDDRRRYRTMGSVIAISTTPREKWTSLLSLLLSCTHNMFLRSSCKSSLDLSLQCHTHTPCENNTWTWISFSSAGLASQRDTYSGVPLPWRASSSHFTDWTLYGQSQIRRS